MSKHRSHPVASAPPLPAPFTCNRSCFDRAIFAVLIGILTGCSGAPSRNILGSYFPSWMVCALAGIAVALAARAIFKASGFLDELPAPVIVLFAIALAATFALWLLWLA